MTEIRREKALVAPKVDEKGQNVSSRGTVDVERIEKEMDPRTLERIKKTRMKGIVVILVIDLILAGFLIYQIVSVFSTIINNIPK